ncbi:alkaline phosphatase [Patulibacter brassicae]|uniref:Alkaline phosphatase n=1 Tax=Patulibacter brassicae TaxID=1705717 RepID=A0ABU4VKH3_9ACTN|nr:alkaline phosphatase [Patulibacter brassicae]MDX8152189.1 alkaline phosphatase [Patulibacter brassicae]
MSPHVPRRRRALLAAAAAAVTLGAAATAVAVVPSGDGDHSATLAGQIDPQKPKNVILLIGDGTDEAIITAARNYEKGAAGAFDGLDSLPFVGDMTTYGLKVGKKANGQYPIAYVSDSAPTASGWSTGKKTVDSRLSQGPSEADTTPGEDYETVLERFKADGKRVGNVSTAALTDATPAAAGAHINLRECQGPENMARCATARKSAGGKGSVAEQLVDNEIDVLLGGGLNRFLQATDDGPTVLDDAKDEHGYRELRTKADLDAVTSLKDGPVLGLFAGSTNPASTTGENMLPLYKPLVAAAGGNGTPAAPKTCEVEDRGTQPRLGDMTQKAIDLLKQENDKGFFLQVESAMVDKQEHAADACGAIGDLAELDRATQIALAFQQEDPNTLIIVTGDHSHSTQIVGGTSGGKATATVKTVDGDPMTIGYSTAEPPINGSTSQGHTGSQIRVAAKGPQAANVNGFIDQTDLYRIMLGQTPSTLPEGPTRTVTTPGATVTVPGATVTVPGPTTTVTQPAPAARPSVSLAPLSAVGRTALRRSGLRVSVAATGAKGVTVELRRGSTTLTRKALGASGGATTLKASTSRGTLRVVVTAKGAGGTATASRSVRVR